VILDAQDARCAPCRPFRLLAFDPGSDPATQDHIATRGFDLDIVGVDLRRSLERLFDPLLDIARRGARLDPDQVGDAFHRLDVPYRLLGTLALELPFDVTFEGEPSVPDGDLDLFGAERKVALQRRDGVARDLGIGPLVQARKLDLDVVRDGAHPPDRFRVLFGLELLAVASHRSGKRHDAVLDRNDDVAGVDVRIPSQFGFHILLDLLVGSHLMPPSDLHRRR
jgi:hypothetical protein